MQSFSAQAAAAIRNARLYEETRRYAERLRALEEVNRLVSSSLNVEEVLQNLARAHRPVLRRAVRQRLGVRRGAQRLRRALTFGDPELAAELRDDLARGRGERWAGSCSTASRSCGRRPPPIRASSTWGRSAPAACARMTVYPIAIGDRMLGAFAVHRAGDVADHAGDQARSWARWPPRPPSASRTRGCIPRRAGDSPRRALLEVAEILNSTLESRTLLKRVTLKVAQGVPRGPLLARAVGRRPGDPAHVAVRRRPPDAADVGGVPRRAAGPPADIPANAQVIETRQPLIIDDCETSPLLPRQWVDAFGLRSCMIVPMLRQEGVIGVMTLDYSDRPARFQDWQRIWPRPSPVSSRWRWRTRGCTTRRRSG